MRTSVGQDAVLALVVRQYNTNLSHPAYTLNAANQLAKDNVDRRGEVDAEAPLVLRPIVRVLSRGYQIIIANSTAKHI